VVPALSDRVHSIELASLLPRDFLAIASSRVAYLSEFLSPPVFGVASTVWLEPSFATVAMSLPREYERSTLRMALELASKFWTFPKVRQQIHLLADSFRPFVRKTISSAKAH